MKPLWRHHFKHCVGQIFLTATTHVLTISNCNAARMSLCLGHKQRNVTVKFFCQCRLTSVCVCYRKCWNMHKALFSWILNLPDFCIGQTSSTSVWFLTLETVTKRSDSRTRRNKAMKLHSNILLSTVTPIAFTTSTITSQWKRHQHLWCVWLWRWCHSPPHISGTNVNEYTQTDQHASESEYKRSQTKSKKALPNLGILSLKTRTIQN